MGNVAPCKECHAKGESYIGCHDKCEKFKKFREGVDSLNKTIRKEKALNGLLNGYNKGKVSGFSHSAFGKS